MFWKDWRKHRIPHYVRRPRGRRKRNVGSAESDESESSIASEFSTVELYFVKAIAIIVTSLAVYAGLELLEDLAVEIILKARISGVLETMLPLAKCVNSVEIVTALIFGYVLFHRATRTSDEER